MTQADVKRKRDELSRLEDLVRRSWAGNGPRSRFLRLEVALWRAKQELVEAEGARQERTGPHS